MVKISLPFGFSALAAPCEDLKIHLVGLHQRERALAEHDDQVELGRQRAAFGHRSAGNRPAGFAADAFSLALFSRDCGQVDADDVVAPARQLEGVSAGAAADVQDLCLFIAADLFFDEIALADRSLGETLIVIFFTVVPEQFLIPGLHFISSSARNSRSSADAGLDDPLETHDQDVNAHANDKNSAVRRSFCATRDPFLIFFCAFSNVQRKIHRRAGMDRRGVEERDPDLILGDQQRQLGAAEDDGLGALRDQAVA